MKETEQELEEVEIVDEIVENEDIEMFQEVDEKNEQDEEVIEEIEDEENTYFEENYERTKPIGRLILLVAFTAIMLVSSTYAWFSTQKNVTIGGLRGEVNVAEGLQISLDAKTWTNTINLNEFSVDTNTKIWTSDKYVPGATFQQPYVIGQKTVTGEDGQQTLVNEYATNVTPEELLPVSTTGGTGEGIGNTIMNMYWGDNTEGIKLSGIKQMTEEAKSGYYAFDIFLQNSSAEGKTVDTLKLAPNSSVVINSTKEETGLQYTARVGFALYENAKDDADTSNDKTVEVKSTPTTAEIIAGTAAGKKIKDVAIWEPNSDVHTTYIVDANNRITWSAADLKEYGFNASATAPAKAKFTGTTSTGVAQIPTYALTSASQTAGTISDIYDWATPGAGLTKQITLQTSADTTNNDGLLEEEAIPLISVAKTEAGAENTEFQIRGGQYCKIRVYVWLEGQDVDCTNYASLGGGLTLDIGILKGSGEGINGDGTDVGGAYLPTGFDYVADAETEVTIADSNGTGNQYVWISVPQDTTVYSASTLALDLDSLSGDELTAAYTAIENDLHTYTETYRNGTTYSDTWYSEAQHGFASADDYNALKYKMLKSVFENGGFYIGKYETGTMTARSSSSDALTTAVIQANAYPYNYVTNKQAQSIASGMASGEYTSSLMFGVQWDLVLKYMETKGVSVADLNSDSTEWGNYSNNNWTIENTDSKYYYNSSWTDGLYNGTGTKGNTSTSITSILLSTGASSEFNKAGIYDLAGNVYEWTLEKTYPTRTPCVARGGNYYVWGSDLPASYRHSNSTTDANRYYGFRVTLY